MSLAELARDSYDDHMRDLAPEMEAEDADRVPAEGAFGHFRERLRDAARSCARLSRLSKRAIGTSRFAAIHLARCEAGGAYNELLTLVTLLWNTKEHSELIDAFMDAQKHMESRESFIAAKRSAP